MNSDRDPILDPLNEEQRKAVTHGEGPLLILAGAGSGKTRTITHRMAYLIRDRGVPPYEILGVTFTNKAAGEMRERTRELVGRSQIQPELSTFHSFGAQLLREEHRALNRDRYFSIYDDADQRTLIKGCMEELGIDSKVMKPRTVVSRISRFKDDLRTPEDVASENEVDDRLIKLYRRYDERLRENNAYDFGDLIAEPVYLFRRNQEVRTRWQQRFNHLMVDEFQDTNAAQYELSRLLSQQHENFVVVGDDDQSIYSWRGADITNILNFEQDFPDTRTIRLERNYRSTQPILDAAHSVIENNSARKPKKLWTAEEAGQQPVVYAAGRDYGEAEYIVETIRLLKKMHGFQSGDFAVFLRTNAQTRVLEEVFMRENLPYVIVSGVGFYERKEIKDLMAYLTLTVNPDDDQALQRIINVPTRGIGPKTLESLREWADEREVSMARALETLDENEQLSGRARSSLNRFADLYEAICELGDAAPREAIEEILEMTRYVDEEVEPEEETVAESRKENIEELIRVADTFQTERADPSLNTFVEEISLMSDVDTFEEQEDRVNIMTLHAAKGLEFPVVFMAGMEEGLMPHSNADYDQDRLEEERRLCYVGITRAQERLYCTWARKRWMYGSEQRSRPSRFLKEANLLDEQEVRDDDPFRSEAPTATGGSETEPATTPSTSTGTSSGGSTSSHEESEVPELAEGDVVRHPKFGRGEVLSVNDSGRQAEIEFDGVGTKRLALGYARLEPV